MTGRDMNITPQQEEAYTTTGGTPHLDGEYTVFGEVVDGLEVVDAIQHVRCDRNDRPLDDVRIIRTELKRVNNFALLSENPSYSEMELREVMEHYGLNLYNNNYIL